jgi:hypothetical protein
MQEEIPHTAQKRGGYLVTRWEEIEVDSRSKLRGGKLTATKARFGCCLISRMASGFRVRDTSIAVAYSG